MNCSTGGSTAVTYWFKSDSGPSNQLSNNLNLNMENHPNIIRQVVGNYDIVFPNVTLEYGDVYICRGAGAILEAKRARLLIIGKSCLKAKYATTNLLV